MATNQLIDGQSKRGHVLAASSSIADALGTTKLVTRRQQLLLFTLKSFEGPRGDVFGQKIRSQNFQDSETG